MEELIVALHMHTVYSDGSGKHAELAEAGLKAGVDVLIVTDHNVLVQDIEGYTQEGKRRLLMLVGEEVHDRTSQVEGNHMLIFGHNSELSRFAPNRQQLIDQARQAGAMTFLAHPFDDPLPGQFVMMRIAGLQDPFLSRPLSIYAFSRSQKGCMIELLYRVAGRGTGIMAGLIAGSEVEVIGPLGQSYRVDPLMKNIVFIAGGIGVAPLSLLAGHLGETVCREASSMTFFLGARTAEEIVGLELLHKYCYRVIVCTDDGSMGEKGQVISVFKKEMAKFPSAETALYACGPRPMLKALAMMVGGKYMCQVSLEERMACGVGACAGCVVAIKEQAGAMAYRRVCADGPVFDLEKVIWQ